MQTEWRRQLTQSPPVRAGDLPGCLADLAGHLGRVGPMFPDDWNESLTLAAWSSLCASVRVENQPVALYWIGINPAGAGKNITSDAAVDACLGAARQVYGRPLLLATGGSVEGICKVLAKPGGERGVLAYYGEFVATLRQLHYSATGREVLCNLYDGRPVATLLAREHLEAVHPAVTLLATTTMAAITEETALSDLQNGFLSRFWWCAPDSLDLLPDIWPTPAEEAAVVACLAARLAEIKAVTRVVLDPDATRCAVEYGRTLGLGSGRRRDLDAERDQPADPPGRLVARAKRVAALLALADPACRPAVTNGDQEVTATAGHLDLARRLVQRGHAYDQRVRSWFLTNREATQQWRVLAAVRADPAGQTLRQIARTTRLYKTEIESALTVLTEDGKVWKERAPSGRKVTYFAMPSEGEGDD